MGDHDQYTQVLQNCQHTHVLWENITSTHTYCENYQHTHVLWEDITVHTRTVKTASTHTCWEIITSTHKYCENCHNTHALWETISSTVKHTCTVGNHNQYTHVLYQCKHTRAYRTPQHNRTCDCKP